MKRTAITLLVSAALLAAVGVLASPQRAQAGHPPTASVRVYVGSGHLGIHCGGFPVYAPVLRPVTPYPVVTVHAPLSHCCHYKRVWVAGGFNPVLGVHYRGYWQLVRFCHVHGRTVIRRY